jgi:hypothetical protein
MKQYGGPGPTTEDVNTMHRYRDAIAIPHPMRPEEYVQGVVTGAAVLFPYPHEEAYRTHRFYKSIEHVDRWTAILAQLDETGGRENQRFARGRIS